MILNGLHNLCELPLIDFINAEKEFGRKQSVNLTFSVYLSSPSGYIKD